MKKSMSALGVAFFGLSMMATTAFASGAASSLTAEEQAEESKNVKILGCLVDGRKALREGLEYAERRDGIRITKDEVLEQFSRMGEACFKREDYSPDQARDFLSKLEGKYGGDKVQEIIADRMLVLGIRLQ